MKNSQVQKNDCIELSGQSSSFSLDTLSKNDKLSNISDSSFICSEKTGSIHNSKELSVDSISLFNYPDKGINFHSKSRSNYRNIVTKTLPLPVQETCSADLKNSFSGESILPFSLTPPYSDSIVNDVLFSKNNINSLPKDNSYSDNNSQNYSVEKIKFSKCVYSSSSSDFVCSKCGLGFPCSVFLCKRDGLSDVSSTIKSESQSTDISLNNINYVNKFLSESPFPEDRTSSPVPSSESTPVLSNQESCNLSSCENSTDILGNTFFLEKQKRHFSFSKEDLSKANKMQNKNYSKELKIDIKLSKDKNISIINDTDAFNSQPVLQTGKEFNSVRLNSSEILAVGNSLNTSVSNSSEAQSSEELPIESLSQGTRNFLNELASNATSSFSDNVSGYALLNSSFSSPKIKIVNETASNDNCKEESISNDESTSLCNIATDSKEVTNALDLIEQSSLHDRDLSSAEICNSLNQIFSEASSDLSANIASNVESNPTEETNTEYETITVSMNDESSEILFQTADPNINLSANTETGTINLADLIAGNDPEILQRILLVHDESGNIETVYLLPEGAQITEGITTELNNVEIIPQAEDIKSDQFDQCIVNNVLVDKPAQVEDVLITQDGQTVENVLITQDGQNVENVLITQDGQNVENVLITQDGQNVENVLITQDGQNVENVLITQDGQNIENVLITEDGQNIENVLITQDGQNIENVFITEDFISKEENKLVQKSNDSPSQTSIEPENINTDYVLTTVENQPELCSKLAECSEQNKTVTSEQIETKNDVDMECTEIIKTNLDKCEILLPNQSLDSLESAKEPLILCEEKSVDNHVTKEFVDVTKSNQIEENISVNLNRNSNMSEHAILNYVPISTKAKKTCRNISDAKNRSINDGTPSSLGVDINSNAFKTSVSTPVNGAVYHSDSNGSLANKTYLSDLSKSDKRELLFNKSLQKSKKTLRTAKKSLGSQINNAALNFSKASLAEAYKLLTNKNSALRDIIQNGEDFLKIRDMILKRGPEDESIIQGANKRLKNDNTDKFNHEKSNDFNGVLKSKSNTVALKTFKKPFTAAKKSCDSSRESLRTLKNTPLRTFVPAGNKVQVAMKSFTNKQSREEPKQVISTSNFLPKAVKKITVNRAQSHQNKPASELHIQPEICEIRILPNDYVKRASHLLFKSNIVEPSTEENVSDEEIKLSSGCSSPFEELMLLKSRCSCTAKEVPCLCNDDRLQLTCEAEDSFDENVISCKNHVSQQYLLTPSSEIKHRAFCDIHLWRLRHHHCCPKCGIFCSQGEFLLCSNDELEFRENHLFHTSCFIVPSSGLPPGCPHCCKFSNFNSVHLLYKLSADEEQKEVPLNAQNITNELDSCDIFLTLKQDTSSDNTDVSKVFVPEKKEIQLMITSLAKENTLRLRPTGKCLYNPVKTGDVQKVMQLLGNGVNPNHKFRIHRNNAPLHVAAHYGWTGILHILLQAGALIDAVNDDLETPLIVAVEKKQLPIVRYLVLAGAQIDVKDCNGMTSFHIASKNGFKDIAEFLFSTGRIDINLQDDGGWTALVWACEHKHVDFVKWLLKIGSDPNVRDNEENTVLHWAAYSGKCEIAELLLEKGCTLSYVNKRGDSALHIAAREDNYECVKLFIERGAVVDQKNKENKTPLMCCQEDSLSFNYLCQAISSGELKIGKNQLEKHVVFRDISRGAEAYPIQAINEVDDEEFIMEFRYVVKQCHRSGVNINSIVYSMQFCYCKDNCVTRDCNCTMNSKCWYDANGCLTSEYDLQSLPPIFECNKTCHCPKTCINRVVQQGLKFPLQIFRTRFQGWGVRSLQNIPKGAFVCEYVGELITGSEATQRDDDTYFFDLESQQADYCLDGRYYGNVARFLNHSCEPNLVALKVFVDHQDLNFPRIAFFAFKEIHAFEELCFDYGLDFWLVKCQSLLCTCKTPSCKYSKDSIDDTLNKFFVDTKNGTLLDSGS